MKKKLPSLTNWNTSKIIKESILIKTISKTHQIMNLPSDLKYTPEHEWLRVENGNIAVVGITDFAQSELGELVYIDIDTVDETLDKNEIFGTVEAVKTTSDLFMPVSGKVIEANKALSDEGDDNPALVNEDPYGKGWIVKIEMSDLTELDELMSAKDYENEVKGSE